MKKIILILLSLVMVTLIVYITLNIRASKVEEQQSKSTISSQQKKNEKNNKENSTEAKENKEAKETKDPKNKEIFDRKDDDPVYKEVDAYLKSINFNGNVTVSRTKDNTMFSKAYGERNLDQNIPNDEHSMYLIGSANKFLTGIMLRQLVDEGKVNINDNVNKYIPNFQKDYPLTVKDLMLHQSGLVKFSPNKNGSGLDGAIETIKEKGVVPNKYHKYEYNDANYITIAKIIEEATNKSVSENLKERIIKKADLQYTARYDDPKLKKYFVDGYKAYPDKNTSTPPTNLDQYDGAGNVYMSTHDMTKLIHSFRSGKLVNKASTQSLLSKDGQNTFTRPYRYGFYQYENHQRFRGMFFSHDVVAYSTDNYVITLASNKLDQPYDENTEKALEHIYTNILKQPK